MDMLNELLVDHYSNTLFLVWQWSAVKGKIYDGLEYFTLDT